MCVTSSDILPSLKNTLEAVITKVNLIMWNNLNKIFKKTLCLGVLTF